MKRTTASGHLLNQYVDQDNASNVAGTQLVAEDRNMIQEELANILTRFSKDLNGARRNQISTLLYSMLGQLAVLSSSADDNRVPTVTRLPNTNTLPGDNADKAAAFLRPTPVTISNNGDIFNARTIEASSNITAGGQLRTNGGITNSAGNGAPNFPNGLTSTSVVSPQIVGPNNSNGNPTAPNFTYGLDAVGVIKATARLQSNEIRDLAGLGPPNFGRYFTAQVGDFITIDNVELFRSVDVPAAGYFYQVVYSNLSNPLARRAYVDGRRSDYIEDVDFPSIPHMGLVPAGASIRGPSSGARFRIRRVL